jgi:sugar lactone lactonase YvrE
MKTKTMNCNNLQKRQYITKNLKGLTRLVIVAFLLSVSCKKDKPAATPVPPNMGVVSTLAGTGIPGFADGAAASAQFSMPIGVAVDAQGVVYVTDAGNGKIRKITTDGMVGTLAGSGNQGFKDGTGTAAEFDTPSGIAVDAQGIVYVADSHNHIIRKIKKDGSVSTFAGDVNNAPGYMEGKGTAARFNNPVGIAVDVQYNVYVADRNNHVIRKITPDGVVSTLAGVGTVQGSADGPGISAKFSSPAGVAVDAQGTVYVADLNNNKIRKITSTGEVSTLAGSGIYGSVNGTGTEANFASPFGVAVDAKGIVYVAENGGAGNKIRKITKAGVASTLAGSNMSGSVNGTGTAAQFKNPAGVAVDKQAKVYVADYSNHVIRKIE